jgi:peroxin-1
LGPRSHSYPFTCPYVLAYAFHLTVLKPFSVSFEPSSAKAVLLANDTELSVAPKTRRHQNSESQRLVNGGNPVVKSDPTTKPHSVAKSSHTVLLHVLPASVFLRDLPSPSDLTSVIYVPEQMLSAARLEGLLPPDPNTTLIARVRRLIPPTDPADATNLPPPDVPAVARVLNPSEATKREDVKEAHSKAGDVRVIGLDGMLEGQMIIVGGVDGVGDWDVVQ